MLKDIKAVIFDLDGTLIDSMWVWKDVDRAFLEKRNIPFPENLQRDIEGLSFTDTAKYFKNRFSLPESIDEIKNEWHESVGEFYSAIIKLKKGVKELLKHLKDNNIKIGIATSNYSQLVKAVLEHNNIYDEFDAIVTTCEVERDKSYPDVFLETAKRLNIPPNECLVFEDTLLSVKGAKLAGMKVVGIFDSHGSCTKEELNEVTEDMMIDFEMFLEKYKK